SPENILTDANGNATTTFTANAAGTATVTASNGSVMGSADVTVSQVVVTPVLTTITVSPSTAMLSIGDTPVFTATAVDQNGNPMEGINITWTTNDTAIGNVSPENILTDANGNATTTFTANAAGTAMVNATNGSVTGIAIVTVPIVPVVQDLILNPGFESGTTSWIFYTNGIGTFTADDAGFVGLKSAKIVINGSGTNTQLYQMGITIEPNTHYRLMFSAKSTMGNDLSVELLKHVSPFTNYGLDKKFDLTSSWQEFSTEFTTSGFLNIVDDGRLKFWLAPFAATGEIYYIDNVRLEKVTGTLSVTTTPASGDIYVDSVMKGTGSWSGLVSVGSHTVSFSPVSGFVIPSMQTVEVQEGLITTVTGIYNITTTTNLINNSGFESGAASWNFYTSGTGTFTAAPPSFEASKSANIALSSAGSNIQLYQMGISVKDNTSYRLSFAAKSMSGQDMEIALIKHVSPFTPYGLDKNIDLTKDWQEFSTEFTTSGFTGTVNDARLMFQLAPFAAAGDKYYIDNVRLEEVQ
ncbi:MAG TPA: carbohydrate binding domain-containing protein, partial [Candidatus Methanoperedens sp.]